MPHATYPPLERWIVSGLRSRWPCEHQSKEHYQGLRTRWEPHDPSYGGVVALDQPDESAGDVHTRSSQLPTVL